MVTAPTPPIQIHAGYRPGLIGRAVELHAVTYATLANFGQPFESQIAAGLAEFAGRLATPRNGIWCATHNDIIVGTIAIDGEDLAPHAHLRWFIVDGTLRGAGIGRRLLSAALSHCDAHGFGQTHLWTFQGLDAARALYEAHGFTLAEQRPGRQWGAEVMEQRFTRPHPQSVKI